ncbi:hypothetical protein AOLI_G00038510 [Acnodon oligacanthus]
MNSTRGIRCREFSIRELRPLVLPLPKPKPSNRRSFNFDWTPFSAPLLGRFSCEVSSVCLQLGFPVRGS